MCFMYHRIYMDYNATTPLEPEVIQAVTEALEDAWGNPSSNYIAGDFSIIIIITMITTIIQ